VRRLVVAVVVALASLLLFAGPSQAAPKALPDILGCNGAPTPQVPGRGLVGFFDSGPATPPPPGDPFADGSKTSIYEQYGYAGLRWNTYDLGCGPDIARSPDASVGTAVANWIMQLPVAAVAATGAVLGEAFSPDFLSAFDPLIAHVVDSLRTSVFERWYVVVLAALGLLLIWRARKASMASTAAAIGWAMFVMVLATMVFRWPLVAGHAADTSVTASLAAVGSGIGGTSDGADAGTVAAAGMQRSLLYQAWLGGTFGSADSDTARRYGPVIFNATALTWTEAATLEHDPAEGKKIVEAKQAAFKQAASEIEENDPDAYEYLTGRRSDTRVGYATIAGLATLCAIPFLFLAGLLVMGAMLIIRIAVMLFPLVGTLGLFEPARQLVLGVLSTCAAAIVNAVLFGIGALVMVAAMGVLIAPAAALAPWLPPVLMLLLTVVMWVALKPFRRLTTMVGGGNSYFGEALAAPARLSGRAAKGAARLAVQAAVVASGSAVGTAAGMTIAEEEAAPTRAEVNTSYEPISRLEPAQADTPKAEGTPAPRQPRHAGIAPAVQPITDQPRVPTPDDGGTLPTGRFEGGDGDWDQAAVRELGTDQPVPHSQED
jgi:hypothetical protein